MSDPKKSRWDEVKDAYVKARDESLAKDGRAVSAPTEPEADLGPGVSYHSPILKLKQNEHWLHCVLTICTGGFWSIIWLTCTLNTSQKNRAAEHELQVKIYNKEK